MDKCLDKLASFRINLRDMRDDSKEFEFHLNDEVLEAMDSLDIQKGDVKVKLLVERLADDSFSLSFHSVGVVQVPCDRCLDDMEVSIDTTNRLIVKLESDYSEEDDIVTIPEEDDYFDTSSYVYQFVILSIPIKHVHAPGKCNAQMIETLNEHLAARSDEDDEETNTDDNDEVDDDDRPMDPRWSELLKIKNNN